MGMAYFNQEETQRFQDSVLERVREMERMLDTQVLEYYRNDRVDSYDDYKENLQGLHNYLKRAYQTLDRLLNEIESRQRSS